MSSNYTIQLYPVFASCGIGTPTGISFVLSLKRFKRFNETLGETLVKDSKCFKFETKRFMKRFNYLKHLIQLQLNVSPPLGGTSRCNVESH